MELEEDGLLVMRFSCKKEPYMGKEIYRWCIPHTDKRVMESVWRWSHQHATAGHFGCNATLLRASERFYFPSMRMELHRRVRQCPSCLAKIRKVQLKDCKAVHATESGFPGQIIYIDLIGPLPENENYKYLLSVQDGFTRYAQCYPIRNKEATTTAQCLIERWISQYGCPGAIHSDRATEFRNKVWTELCDRLQIAKTTTPGYSPQSNLVERWHRVLNAIMRTYLERDDPGWLKVISLSCLAYNSKVHTTTKISPFEAFFGRRARLPIDLIMRTPDKRYDLSLIHI